jgi:hypothetical protein
VSELQLSGTVELQINRMGAAVNESISTSAGAVPIVFSNGTPVTRVAGTVTMSVGGFATGSGAFAITKTPGELTIGATNVSAFVGSGGMGVQLSNGKLGAVIATTGTNAGKYALEASGTVALANIPLLTMSGTMNLELQRMDAPVNRTIATPGGDVTLSFGADPVTRLTGTVEFGVEGFVSVDGDFALEKTTLLDGTTRLTAAAENLNAFLGVNYKAAGEFGVKVTGATLGLVVDIPTSGVPEFALSASDGIASLAGFDGLKLAGPIDIDFNRLGKSLSLSIPAPDGSLIPMSFPQVDDITQFGGNLTLGVGTFAEIGGSFGIEKQTIGGVTKILVGGTNISAFVGEDSDTNHFNENERGVQITNGTLGVAIYKEGSVIDYAVRATGNVALAGIDGFELSGTASVEVNNTGAAVSETITTPGGTTTLSFTSSPLQRVAGTVTMSVGGFATGSGAFAIEKAPGELTIGATNVSAFVGLR